MTHEELLARVIIVDPKVCAGKPSIRGTRIYIAISLDALAEGLTPEEIMTTIHPSRLKISALPLNRAVGLTVLQPSDTVFANVSSVSNVNFHAE